MLGGAVEVMAGSSGLYPSVSRYGRREKGRGNKKQGERRGKNGQIFKTLLTRCECNNITSRRGRRRMTRSNGGQ